MQWFKLHNDIIHDPKLKVLAFEDRWHFVALMCLQNDGTLDEPEDILPELIAQSLGIHGPDLDSLKERLIRVRLIDDDWRPRNWNRRQVSSDATNAERQKRYREKQRDRKLSNGSNAVTVTDRPLPEEEVEKEKEVISDRELRFDQFWSLYPKKTAKPAAKKAYNKIKAKEHVDICAHLKKRAWPTDRQFIPNPATFINNRRWEDELEPQAKREEEHYV